MNILVGLPVQQDVLDDVIDFFAATGFVDCGRFLANVRKVVKPAEGLDAAKELLL
jgi:hypothetical protein